MTVKTSPMMQQWQACKKKAPNALLLFRLGDFYEAFYEDAEILSRVLNLTLTKRQEIPMSGVPAHTCEAYLEKLIAKGLVVAIAEQMENPKDVKGIVKRDIVKVLSPGTYTSASYLSEKANNFIICMTQINSIYALAILDLSTSEFKVSEFSDEKELYHELYRRRPAEILISDKIFSHHKHALDQLKQDFPFRLNLKENFYFDHRTCYDFLTRHFRLHTLDGLGLKGMPTAINAAAVLLMYIQEDMHLPIDQIKKLQLDHLESYMRIDASTQRHLELTEPLHQKTSSHTLLSILDKTLTPMGGRLFKNHLVHPLLSPEKIHMRQDVIQAFLENYGTSLKLSSHLRNVRDLERLITRITGGNSSPRDLIALNNSLKEIPPISELLTPFSTPLLISICSHLIDTTQLTDKIASTLNEDLPLRLSDGNVIKEGHSAELDTLRNLKRDNQSWIANYQEHLRNTLGIKTLKINYTKAFGYYIEVSRTQGANVPATFEKRQTLVNSHRFISPELKDYEEKILSAEDQISILEQKLYHELKEAVSAYAEDIRKIARGIANLDVHLSLCHVAKEHHYTRPLIDASNRLEISHGRHPVIECSMNDQTFIPNDTHLNGSDRLLYLITGPNMAGKSTYIRQVALITIMAQMGSFVPAKSAHIGIIDKVFSRIGASDDLSRGQSTFMVEMSETANILNNATSKSLIILDEIGRGTSTYDGISIAYAVAEYLLKEKQTKTLFATHYWELTQLEEKIPGALNYNVAVKETSEGIVFMRKIIRGGTDKSYGIHVARLAGLPQPVLKRAEALLQILENKPHDTPKKKSKSDKQLLLFSLES